MVNLNFLDHPQENFILLNFQFGSINGTMLIIL